MLGDIFTILTAIIFFPFLKNAPHPSVSLSTLNGGKGVFVLQQMKRRNLSRNKVDQPYWFDAKRGFPTTTANFLKVQNTSFFFI